ncbi:tRNA-specific adenosine deaminase [Formosimonas limnophila]|uniref:tRNA-specific adenosine deaminase n=1 Tax=Formosimonas limnophila TaxID=1384487 RepID=A0A8J3G0Y0_9BURK|nr:tRNA adenosine(34) deaminase TadA [Formosimonas limnophila]GHA77928.1 tRNA-specific adenosine deaminase [Formosimonas limnophila]
MSIVWENKLQRDEFFMRYALAAAQKAYDIGEVPVGAVLVKDNMVVAEGYNQSITTHDASAHAEMQALRAAGLSVENYRLPDCELYVTLEPCLMCAGAMFHARVSRVVYATPDPKTGVAGSVLNLFDEARLNHHATVEGGVLLEEAKALLQQFFRERRQIGKA